MGSACSARAPSTAVAPCKDCATHAAAAKALLADMTRERCPNGMSADPATRQLVSQELHTVALQGLLRHAVALHWELVRKTAEYEQESKDFRFFPANPNTSLRVDKAVIALERARVDAEDADALYMDHLVRYQTHKTVRVGPRYQTVAGPAPTAPLVTEPEPTVHPTLLPPNSPWQATRV